MLAAWTTTKSEVDLLGSTSVILDFFFSLGFWTSPSSIIGDGAVSWEVAKPSETMSLFISCSSANSGSGATSVFATGISAVGSASTSVLTGWVSDSLALAFFSLAGWAAASRFSFSSWTFSSAFLESSSFLVSAACVAASSCLVLTNSSLPVLLENSLKSASMSFNISLFSKIVEVALIIAACSWLVALRASLKSSNLLPAVIKFCWALVNSLAYLSRCFIIRLARFSIWLIACCLREVPLGGVPYLVSRDLFPAFPLASVLITSCISWPRFATDCSTAFMSFWISMAVSTSIEVPRLWRFLRCSDLALLTLSWALSIVLSTLCLCKCFLNTFSP